MLVPKVKVTKSVHNSGHSKMAYSKNAKNIKFGKYLKIMRSRRFKMERSGILNRRRTKTQTKFEFLNSMIITLHCVPSYAHRV